MPNVTFEDDATEKQEVDVTHHQIIGGVEIPEEPESKSEIALWLAQHKFVSHAKAGELRTIIIAVLIILVAIAIFMYGKGKREATNLEQTGNVYLETQR